MQQLGTCRALLLDNGDDEFELDPFPEPVPNSPSSHRHHAPGSSSGGRWQTYAGLEILQVCACVCVWCVLARDVAEAEHRGA